MKSIAFIIGDLCFGGIPRFLMNLGTELRDKFDFHFIATDNTNINPIFNSLGRASYLKINQVAQYLKENKIDLVQYGNKLEYKEAALHADVPVIIERTAGPRSCNLDRTGVSHVISSTNGTIPLIRKNYSGGITTIYNGLDTNKYNSVKPNRLHFKKDDFVICYCARMGGVGQGFESLIKAVVGIRDQYKFKLVLIGDKPEHSAEDIRPRLKKLSAPMGTDCVFTGAMYDPAPVMAGADLYFCPARHHGISNSLIESAALGLPIIATDVGQTNEIVHQGKNGYLVLPDNISSMANHIVKLYNSPEKRKQFGQYGKELVAKEFDIKIQASKYLELYNSLLLNILN